MTYFTFVICIFCCSLPTCEAKFKGNSKNIQEANGNGLYFVSELEQMKPIVNIRRRYTRDNDNKNNVNKTSDGAVYDERLRQRINPKTTANEMMSEPESDESNNRSFNLESEDGQREGENGTPFWIYLIVGAVILIGLTTFVVALFLKRHQIFKRKLGTRQDTLQTETGDRTQHDTHKSYNSDKSKSTVSTYLSSYSDAPEVMELKSMKQSKRRHTATLFEECDYREAPRDAHFVERATSPEFLQESSAPLLNCLSRNQGEYDTESTTTRRSLFNIIKDDGYKLKGGGEVFDRRYNDIDYMPVKREPQKRGRNVYSSGNSGNYSYRRRSRSRDKSGGTGSASSHHSARSYISMPPTSPSENYIEVGSDDTSVRSERINTSQFKMEWLTKSVKSDSRNDLRNYFTTSETQTDSTVSSTNNKTVFGTQWQFGGTFNSRGGVMQSSDSAISLTVVANAILKGEYMDIYGAVFTDTTEIRKKFQIAVDEYLVTPVVEYSTNPTGAFQRHVCIHLPHCLSEDFNISSLNVYTFKVDEVGRISQKRLPFKTNVNLDKLPESFWEKGLDGSSIQISSTHFSGYFCTVCETKSLPSICTMVFGSHVQMDKSRREVRVILYVWDRRLTIKDYLERFKKQELDVDRQLLTDMQIPLLEDAQSDSYLLMKMETMGNERDRGCWHHINRPNSFNPLFKPLQKRKLSEIVNCCRQTDPLRVEWALENMPNLVPNENFQCIIDIMHVPESTQDFERAMAEDSEDIMRTIYVRDLNVTPTPQMNKYMIDDRQQRIDIKRMLSDAMDSEQTQRVCEALGMTWKDIGNFRKKFSNEPSFQVGLVEECVRRCGEEKFVRLLPAVLKRLQMDSVLSKLQTENIDFTNLHDFKGVSNNYSQSNSYLQQDNTESIKINERNGSSPNKSNTGSQTNQNIQSQVSQVSDQVFIQEEEEFAAQSNCSVSRNPTRGQNAKKYHKSLSSGSDSVLRDSSLQSRMNSPNQNCNGSSLDGFSIIAQADTSEFAESQPLSQLPEYDSQTFAKEIVRQSPPRTFVNVEVHGYPEISDEVYASHNGPAACRDNRTREGREEPQGSSDQTYKKESYNTVV